jgi:hypothetical protein
MDLVDFKNSLADHNLTHGTVQDVAAKIQTIPNHQLLKLDPELTLYVCNSVENIVGQKSSTSTIDKSNMVVTIFNSIFPGLTEDEIDYVKKQIRYFWSNSMIKRRGFFVKYGILTLNLLKKKLL